jgi:UDP-N-acetylglucosamine--N-acetylmuramyl-(pentapeptide) pyrophosphoryl-undecaprenol N-acetylglucosamine transferase
MDMRIAVACGGTGGHIFPGLATARELVRRGHHVTLWLGGRDVESTSIRGWDGPILKLSAQGLQGGLLNRFKSLFLIIKAIRFATYLMREDRPDVVLGMGSYSSVAPGLAAWRLGIPLVLHEGNAVPGRAIASLSLLARKIGTGFPNARFRFAGRKTVYCGFPLREGFLLDAAGSSDAPLQLLITGGSQGARILNRVVPQAIRQYLDAGGPPLQVVHLSGEREYEEVVERYHGLEDTVSVEAFSENMLSLYKGSSFAVTRAGAATCTELAVMRLPALLVPLAIAPGNHQWHNAQAVAREGGFTVLSEDRFTPEAVAQLLSKVFEDKALLESMHASLPGSVRSDATQKLADLVESSCRATKLG